MPFDDIMHKVSSWSLPREHILLFSWISEITSRIIESRLTIKLYAG